MFIWLGLDTLLFALAIGVKGWDFPLVSLLLYASCLWVSLETSHIASGEMHHYFSCDLLLLYIGPLWCVRCGEKAGPSPVIRSQQCGEPRSLDCDLYNHFWFCFLLFLRWVGAVWYFLLPGHLADGEIISYDHALFRSQMPWMDFTMTLFSLCLLEVRGDSSWFRKTWWGFWR